MIMETPPHPPLFLYETGREVSEYCMVQEGGDRDGGSGDE